MPRHWSKELMALLPEGRGLCLDVGCGSGEGKKLIKRFGYEWVGLDVTPSKNITVLGDAHRLPFADGVFELVVSIKTMEHLHNPWKSLRDVNRVMKSGGTLLGSVAFLEPFHMKSYFHFSHLGVEMILKESGFSSIETKPGSSIFEELSGRDWKFWGFPPLPIKVLETVVGVFMFIRKKVGSTYIKRRLGSEGAEKYLREEPFRFATEILFSTVKLKSLHNKHTR